MPVFRMTPRPVGEDRGQLIVAEGVARATRVALQDSSGLDGKHEGIVFWLGRRAGEDALVVSAYVPRSNHGSQFVHADEVEVGRMSRYARSLRLTLVAQVHSHPGDDTRHSDGDDRLIVMPHEGMFSLVVGQYGQGSISPKDGCGVHQFQDNRWVHVPDADDVLVLIPPLNIPTT